MVKVAVSYGHGENTYREKKSKGVTVGGVAYAEHTHNAEVGTRVTKILKDHGVQVLEVQPAFGRDVPLSTRIANANNWKADLYYSIHSNAGVPEARGWCGFFWAGSKDGERIANLYLNNMSQMGLPLYHGGKWGSIRGTWNAFQELQDTDMVALLTENGFMTNSQDFQYIFKNKDDYYNRSAIAHAKTILAYFNIEYKRATTTTAPASTTTSTGNVKIGDVVTVRKTATHYETGQSIASFVKGSKYKVLKVKDVNISRSKKSYLLDGIMSWVLEQDIEGGSATVSTPKATTTDLFRIEVLASALWYYDRPDWNAKKAQVHKGDVFTVVQELTVNGSKMYKLKSGTYITANPQYVKKI